MRATLKPARSAIFSALALVAFSTLNSPNALAQAPGSEEAWGYNFSGQLGDGTTTDRLTPVAVTGLGNVMSVAGGMGHSLAVLGDGTGSWPGGATPLANWVMAPRSTD